MPTTIKQKQVSFGGGSVTEIYPKDARQVKSFTIHLDFDEVLRLKAAIDEGAATLNRNDRATREGKRAGMWLAVFPDAGKDHPRWTAGRTTLTKTPRASSPTVEPEVATQ